LIVIMGSYRTSDGVTVDVVVGSACLPSNVVSAEELIFEVSNFVIDNMVLVTSEEIAWNNYARLVLSSSGYDVSSLAVVLKMLDGPVVSVNTDSIMYLDGIDGDDCLLVFASVKDERRLKKSMQSVLDNTLIGCGYLVLVCERGKRAVVEIKRVDRLDCDVEKEFCVDDVESEDSKICRRGELSNRLRVVKSFPLTCGSNTSKDDVDLQSGVLFVPPKTKRGTPCKLCKVGKLCHHHKKDVDSNSRGANRETYVPYQCHPGIPRTVRGKPCKLCLKGSRCHHHRT
jgi:hypothetical protein